MCSCSPVDKADGEVERDEDQELRVEQFVDAALPLEQELGEGAQAGISHTVGVGHCHHSSCAGTQQAGLGASAGGDTGTSQVSHQARWKGRRKQNELRSKARQDVGSSTENQEEIGSRRLIS